jgi:hypothetical protein
VSLIQHPSRSFPAKNLTPVSLTTEGKTMKNPN